MAGVNETEKSNVTNELKPDHHCVAEHGPVSGEDEKSSHSTSLSSKSLSEDAIASAKGHKEPFPLSNHHCSKADGSDKGMQSPWYTGCAEQPVPNGSEAKTNTSCGTAFTEDVHDQATSGLGIVKNGPSLAATGGFKRFHIANSKVSGSNFGRQAQPVKPLDRVSRPGSEFSNGVTKEHHREWRPATFANGSQGSLPHSSGRSRSGNDNYESRYKTNKKEDFETRPELSRGPRSYNKNSKPNLSTENKGLGFLFFRGGYNLSDFQTEYEDAKFYVIKSFSEDDIHKSIKYDVWASTPTGNIKLDRAFRETEAKARERGARCPIFLFFSVNRSGQFVGVAEMMGPVDFNKDMDFWAVDKWNGFFPVRWHIIKDVPNAVLRHIILENNDKKDVTFTRDTHEVFLNHGLEMLKIFKSYAAKTSLLDDFDFYESREKALLGKKSSKPAMPGDEMYHNDNFPMDESYGDRNTNSESTKSRRSFVPPSLINHTRNLSLNGPSFRNNAVKKNHSLNSNLSATPTSRAF